MSKKELKRTPSAQSKGYEYTSQKLFGNTIYTIYTVDGGAKIGTISRAQGSKNFQAARYEHPLSSLELAIAQEVANFEAAMAKIDQTADKQEEVPFDTDLEFAAALAALEEEDGVLDVTGLDATISKNKRRRINKTQQIEIDGDLVEVTIVSADEALTMVGIRVAGIPRPKDEPYVSVIPQNDMAMYEGMTIAAAAWRAYKRDKAEREECDLMKAKIAHQSEERAQYENAPPLQSFKQVRMDIEHRMQELQTKSKRVRTEAAEMMDTVKKMQDSKESSGLKLSDIRAMMNKALDFAEAVKEVDEELRQLDAQRAELVVTDEEVAEFLMSREAYDNEVQKEASEAAYQAQKELQAKQLLDAEIAAHQQEEAEEHQALQMLALSGWLAQRQAEYEAAELHEYNECQEVVAAAEDAQAAELALREQHKEDSVYFCEVPKFMRCKTTQGRIIELHKGYTLRLPKESKFWRVESYCIPLSEVGGEYVSYAWIEEDSAMWFIQHAAPELHDKIVEDRVVKKLESKTGYKGKNCRHIPRVVFLRAPHPKDKIANLRANGEIIPSFHFVSRGESLGGKSIREAIFEVEQASGAFFKEQSSNEAREEQERVTQAYYSLIPKIGGDFPMGSVIVGTAPKSSFPQDLLANEPRPEFIPIEYAPKRSEVREQNKEEDFIKVVLDLDEEKQTAWIMVKSRIRTPTRDNSFPYYDPSSFNGNAAYIHKRAGEHEVTAEFSNPLWHLLICGGGEPQPPKELHGCIKGTAEFWAHQVAAFLGVFETFAQMLNRLYRMHAPQPSGDIKLIDGVITVI